MQLIFDALDVVLLADETSVDDAIAITGHQPTVTSYACETRHMVDGIVLLSLHDELVGRYRLAAGSTSARRAVHSETPNRNRIYFQFDGSKIRKCSTYTSIIRQMTAVPIGGKHQGC